MDRMKRRTVGSYPLTATAYDVDGNEATIVAPVSLTIYDGAGTSIYTTTPSITQGVLSADVPYAELPNLDTYNAVWTGTVGGVAQSWETPFELVGGFIFEVSELRAFDSRNLSDGTRFPTESLKDRRSEAEDAFEARCGCAFVPRGSRETIIGNGRQKLLVEFPFPTEIYSVTVDGVALTAPEIAALTIHRWGAIESTTYWTDGSVIVIHYAHGFTVPPAPVKRAVLTLASEYAKMSYSSVPARATATTIGDQTFRITVAGRDGRFGIPDVDAVASQYDHTRPVIG